MQWPIQKPGARLLCVVPDETDGKLSVWADFGGGQKREMVYEGMFCSQLDQGTVGVTVVSVCEIAPEELWKHHALTAGRLFADCGADEAFLKEMQLRGNHLYLHKTLDGGEYLVLAKRLALGEPLPEPNPEDSK